MKQEVVARRLVHLLIALAPLYYFLPKDLPYIGVPRWAILIIFFATAMVIEAVRLPKGIMVLGMRPYEKNQIASFAWAATGITAALWLFPHDIAAATLVGMAFVDPLAGELRSRGVSTRDNVAASSAAYLSICIALLVFVEYGPISAILPLAVLGTVVAVASEHFKSRYMDDDFLMLVAPGIAMTALALVL